jgi:phospholipase/carboxylesterase
MGDRPHLYRPGGARVLLVLHGTGGDEHQIAPLAEAIDPDATVLAPRGAVTENGSLRWFRREAEGVFDVDDVVRRAAELADFVRWAVERYELHAAEIVPVGFSNGANMALALGVLHPDVARRVIAFSGMYPLGQRDIETRLDGSAVLLLGGDADPMAPAASVDRLQDALESRGAVVDRRRRVGGHGIVEEEIASARGWLAAG